MCRTENQDLKRKIIKFLLLSIQWGALRSSCVSLFQPGSFSRLLSRQSFWGRSQIGCHDCIDWLDIRDWYVSCKSYHVVACHHHGFTSIWFRIQSTTFARRFVSLDLTKKLLAGLSLIDASNRKVVFRVFSCKCSSFYAFVIWNYFLLKEFSWIRLPWGQFASILCLGEDCRFMIYWSVFNYFSDPT